MTRSIPYTQASLRRAIEAARKAGLYVTGIKPDGTILVSDRPEDDSQKPNNGLEQEREIVL
jgi:hypothetical protein